MGGKFRKLWKRLFSGRAKAVGSHLFAFLIPFLLVSFIWFETSTESVNQQVAMNAKNQLVQLKYSFENNLLQLDNITQLMPYDFQVSLSNLEHPYYSREGQASLQKNKISNEIVEEIYVHYKDKEDTLFSSTGSISMDLFLQKEIPDSTLDHTQLIKKINSTIPILLTTRENGQDRTNPKFFYIVPLQNSEMVVYGSVIYTIKETSLLRLLDISNNDGVSTNYLVNDQNQIIASTGDNELSEYLGDREHIASLKTKREVTYQGATYLVEHLQNKMLNLSYISVTNPVKALSTINQMQENFISIFLTVLAGGIIFVIILGLRSYRPIRKIEGLVKTYSHDLTNNEIAQLDVHQTIAQFLLDHQELHEEIRMQTPHAREQVLRKLLEGRFKSEEELHLLLQSVHIELPVGQYFVVAIHAHSTKFVEEDETVFLMDYVEKIQEAGFSAYATEILSTGTIVLTIGFKEGNQIGILQAISELLSEKLDAIPKMGVGNLVEDLRYLNVSYIEALAALDYYPDTTKTVYYADIASEEYSATISYPDGMKLKLIQSLNQGDLAIATETIQRLIEHGIEKQPSLTAQKMYGFYILNTLAQTGSSLVGKEVLLAAEKSATFASLQDLEKNLLKLAELICQEINEKPQNQESQLQQRLFQYIQEHFTSSQLSLEVVAEEFDLSVSYLSRFIKKESGLTFSKYIQGLRLEKIKQLLIETDLPIKEIIRECGYYDVSNYTRKFRTIVGVTPGQFRTMKRSMS